MKLGSCEMGGSDRKVVAEARRTGDGQQASAEQIDEQLIRDFARFRLIGRAPAFLETLRMVRRFAAHDVPLLVLGPTGTGKELIARSVHYLSRRHDHPFIPVNCGGLPDDLFENELFGHERGAFTGALATKPGLIARAAGGTLLLDEVDSLSPRAQVALLRFLQDGSYRPLGGTRQHQADVRIIAASNADLDRLVESGRFRQDLLYRIDVMRLRLPPLRERGDDVVLLARHFLRHFADCYAQPIPELTPAFEGWLRQQPWPGNVRELENTLHRLFLLADGGPLGPEALPSSAPSNDAIGPFNQARRAVVEAFERSYLRSLMVAARGNISEAARRAGKERKAFGRLLKKHALRREDFLAP